MSNRVTINVPALLAALEEPIKRSTRPIATRIAERKFEQAKSEFLKEFLEHPISRELEGQPTQDKSIIGEGTLFGFIGFQEGSTPVEDLYNFLDENIAINRNGLYNRSNKTYMFAVDYPSKEEIKKVTPMPWGTSKSWAFAIESGISGLNQYLFKESYGRSGQGIQIKNSKKRGTVFKPKKYMSQLLNFFDKSLR